MIRIIVIKNRWFVFMIYYQVFMFVFNEFYNYI